VWDDEQFVVKNAYLLSWSSLPRLLRENIVAGAGLRSNLYRPLQSLTHFIDMRIWGYQPWGHHLSSVLLHSGAAAAAFLWLSGFVPPPAAAGLAAVVSLHPLQSEAVAYVSGRGDTLAVLFLCLGLWLFRSGRRGWALACAALAAASKESMALFPLFLALDGWARGQKWEARDHAPFWLLSAAYVAARLTALNFADTLNFYGHSTVLSEHASYRLWTYLTTLPEGLRLWLWPSDLHHERSWTIFTSLMAPRVALSAAVCAAWLAGAWSLRRRAPAAAAGMAWFVIATLPTSNLFVIINALFFDHWFIVPGLGLALAATALAPLREARAGAVAACAALAFAGAAQASALDRFWLDGESLNSRILSFEPRDARAHNNLAMALSERGRLAEAEDHYRQAIALDDEYPQTHHNLARVYEASGRADDAAAEYRRAVQLDPTFFHSWDALGSLELRRGRRDEARSSFESALKAYPFAVEAYLGMAQLRLDAHDAAGAAAELRKGLQQIDDPQLRQALSMVQSRN
jgi:Flp pilus assembly protein TadD